MQGASGRLGVYDGKIAGLYDLEETLGSGHFAVVKLARHVFTGEKVAVKVIDKTKLDEVSRAHLFQEVRCMKLVQHPNVVRLYEVIDTQTKLYLILELGDGGDLYDYIMKHEGGLTETLAREYFRQIVRAISYCHQLHVVHRDLKPENVVFFEKLGVVKLTDFGFSNKFCPGQKLETSCGSLAYSAPEILLGDSYDAPAVDVWSLGVILFMLIAGHPPFQEANDSETLTMIMDCKYIMPPHVSEGCRRLISKMLVREPDKRATLQMIAQDEWLTQGGSEHVPEYLPLVSRQQVSEDDHNLIIQKMVNGNIATKEEVLESLDKNDYNHITATYFLLAERKLRTYRQEQPTKQRAELTLPIISTSLSSTNESQQEDSTTEQSSNRFLLPPGGTSLTVPRLMNDTTPTGRTRKCSIVQEEDDDEDEGDGDDISNTLNRRGSRSEGRINITVQDRLAETERLKKEFSGKTAAPNVTPSKCVFDGIGGVTLISSNDSNLKEKLGKVNNTGVMRRPNDFRPRTADPKLSALAPINNSSNSNNNNINSNYNDKHNISSKNNNEASSHDNINSKKYDVRSNSMGQNVIPADYFESDSVSSKFLTESSTVSIPMLNNQNKVPVVGPPKYKTMPSPTRTSTILPESNCLNEIFEEGTDVGSSDTSATNTPRPITRNFTNNRTQTSTANSSQRRSKFHKTRTTSCSSSDDDDSENRKKRAHKIVDSTKPFPPQRRDSHDDSSDSQDPSNGATSGANSTSQCDPVQVIVGSHTQDHDSVNQSSDGNINGRQNKIGFRRHRAGRRRAGETRLRESQSLNRITEVQESEFTLAPINSHHPNDKKQTTPSPSTSSYATVSSNNKSKMGFGARFFQGFRKTDTSAVPASNSESRIPSPHLENKNGSAAEQQQQQHTARSRSASRGKVEMALEVELAKALKVTTENKGTSAAKKLKMLGRYFQNQTAAFEMPSNKDRYKITMDNAQYGTLNADETETNCKKRSHNNKNVINDKVDAKTKALSINGTLKQTLTQKFNII